MIRRACLWLEAFLRDRQGLAAIEFAMLAPVMLLLYFGMAEFSQAYVANRRANHSASIIADLVAQGENTTPAEIDLAFKIGDLVLAPLDPAPLSIRVSSITLNDKGEAKVDWSRSSGTGLPKFKKGDNFGTIPSGMIVKDQSLIVGETHYSYNSNITRVIKRPLTFSRRYFLRPRSLEKINCKDC